jgi:hypothetical protein
MPLTLFRTITQIIERDESSTAILSTWQNLYNRIENTAAVSLELNSDVAFSKNAEIIIRNSADSLDAITITEGGNASINVSPDLGLVIPIGGIGQLKRIGNTDAWDFYGYIEA